MSSAGIWPVCPRPESDESLPSWFERVCHEYQMSPTVLLGVLERDANGKKAIVGIPNANRLLDNAVADRIAVWAQLSGSEINALWPPVTHWELRDGGFCCYCPHCCLEDLAHQRTPYGRRCWQQSWFTICKAHGTALVVRNKSHVTSNRSLWPHAVLKVKRKLLARNRYRYWKVRSQPVVRSNILGSLMEIDRTTTAAIAGTAPNPLLWGKLTAPEFLTILEHVTTWALTHFEPVRSWSVAEDFTPTEEREGNGFIGRGHRMSASDYRPERLTRCLREITNPKVHGAALWTAHAVLASCHTAASDRSSGATPQDRQVALLAGAAPASRQWLAQRQADWPPEYRRSRWIDLQEML